MVIKVIYATETGNAELVAEDIVDTLTKQGKVATAIDIAKFTMAELTPIDFYIFICSTYGDGELPNSAQPFLTALETHQPDLAQLCFSIFGLGDSYYQTYNCGSQTLASGLMACHAKQLGNRGEHDATTGTVPGDVALDWLTKEVIPHL